MFYRSSILVALTSITMTFSAQAGLFTSSLVSDKGTCISDDGQYEMNYKEVRVSTEDNWFQYGEYKYTQETMELRSLKGNGKFDGVFLDNKGSRYEAFYELFEHTDKYTVSVKIPDSKGAIKTIHGVCKMDTDVKENTFFNRANNYRHHQAEKIVFQRNLTLVIPEDNTTIGREIYENGKESGNPAIKCSIYLKSSPYSKYTTENYPKLSLQKQKITLKSVNADSKGFLIFQGDTQNEWIRVMCRNADYSSSNEKLPAASEEELYQLIKEAFPAGMIQ